MKTSFFTVRTEKFWVEEYHGVTMIVNSITILRTEYKEAKLEWRKQLGGLWNNPDKTEWWLGSRWQQWICSEGQVKKVSWWTGKYVYISPFSLIITKSQIRPSPHSQMARNIWNLLSLSSMLPPSPSLSLFILQTSAGLVFGTPSHHSITCSPWVSLQSTDLLRSPPHQVPSACPRPQTPSHHSTLALHRPQS